MRWNATADDVKTPRSEMETLFPLAIAATTVVFGLPGASAFIWMSRTASSPPVGLIAVASVLASALLSVAGTSLWVRSEHANSFSFGDLMLWNWFRMWRSERVLRNKTGRLGLRRDGLPEREVTLTRAEHLKLLHELSHALEDKDPYTHGHSRRVARHAYRIGAAMGLSFHDLDTLRTAAQVHDVGKIRIPDAILRKPGKLTPAEYDVIKEHSVVGAYMVAAVGDMDTISAVRHHHERWDGGGYPDGLRGTDIPLFARILAVADTYDAITSSRPYRLSSGRSRAIQTIKEEAGRQFDPMVVEAFLSSLPAPVPVVAGIIAVLPGSVSALRKGLVLVKKMGSATIMQTATAAGVSVAISTAVVVPVANLERGRSETRSVAKVLADGTARSLEAPKAADGEVISAPGSLTNDGGRTAGSPDAGSQEAELRLAPRDRMASSGEPSPAGTPSADLEEGAEGSDDKGIVALPASTDEVNVGLPDGVKGNPDKPQPGVGSSNKDEDNKGNPGDKDDGNKDSAGDKDKGGGDKPDGGSGNGSGNGGTDSDDGPGSEGSDDDPSNDSSKDNDKGNSDKGNSDNGGGSEGTGSSNGGGGSNGNAGGKGDGSENDPSAA